jgi:hypothetical protein
MLMPLLKRQAGPERGLEQRGRNLTDAAANDGSSGEPASTIVDDTETGDEPPILGDQPDTVSIGEGATGRNQPTAQIR